MYDLIKKIFSHRIWMKSTLNTILLFALLPLTLCAQRSAVQTATSDTLSVMMEVEVSPVVVGAERSQIGYTYMPLSTTALRFSGTLPAGRDLRMLSSSVPNFYMQESGMRISNPIYVRGVGSTMGMPPVGLYVDGVPYFDRDAFFLEMLDVRRVEVARGPQTTLYGRNSIMGQVNVSTTSPAEVLGVQGFISYGSFRFLGALISADLPFGAVRNRIVVHHRQQAGYFHNRFTGKRDAASGSQLLRYRGEVTLPRSASLEWGMTLSKTRDDGYGYHALDSLRVSPFWVNYNTPASIERQRALVYFRSLQSFSTIDYSATISYSYNRDHQTMDTDFTHYDIFDNTRRVGQHLGTAEVLVRGTPLPNLAWLAGVFGFYRTSDLHYTAHFGEDKAILLGRAAAILDSMNYFNVATGYGAALFTQVRWIEPFTKIQLTAGVRGEWERAALAYHELLTIPSGSVHPWGEQHDSRDYVKPLPRISLLRDWGERLSLYVTVARGYKAGGHNALNNDPMNREVDLHYDGETLWSYEFGIKALSPKRLLHSALSFFFLDWRDQQIFVIERMGPAIRNAGDVRSYGVELEIGHQPLSWLSLSLAGGYNSARYARHTNPDVVGKRSVMSPEFTLNGALNGRWGFGSTHRFVLTASVNYAAYGRQFFDELNTLGQDFHGVLGGELGLSYRWFLLRAWVQNALDSRHFAYMFMSPVGKALPSYAHSGQVAAPRTLGVSLGVNI